MGVFADILLLPFTALYFRIAPLSVGEKAFRGLCIQYGLDPISIPLPVSRRIAAECLRVIDSIASLEKRMGRRQALFSRQAAYYGQLAYVVHALIRLRDRVDSLEAWRANHPSLSSAIPGPVLVSIAGLR